MNVGEMMSWDVRTCRPEDGLHVAAEILWNHDVGCVPVVDADARVVGMITDRDICMSAYTSGQSLASLTVARAMARDVACCKPKDTLARAEQRMQASQVRRLPVVDDDGRIVGILSMNDLARASAARVRRSASLDAHTIVKTLAAIGRPRSDAALEGSHERSEPPAELVPPRRRSARKRSKRRTKPSVAVRASKAMLQKLRARSR